MIIAIDIETYEYDPAEDNYKPILDARKFSIGCAKKETGETYYFYTPQEMFEWIMKTIEQNRLNGKRTFIYGHNTEYDWYGLAQGNLLDNRIKYVSFHPFIAIIQEKGYILDTMAFYRMSLEKVGEILNFPKLEMPTKVKQINDLKEYVTRDVEITLQAVLDLKKKMSTLGFNPRKLLTAGQLAMSSFLSFVNKKKLSYILQVYDKETKYKIVVPCQNAEMIREAYRGGNNTAYQTGKFEEVTLLDIVALYGKIMRDMDFPDLKTEQLIRIPEVGMLQAYFDDFVGVAECQVTAPNLDYGFLPIRFGGYQMFPTSRVLIGTWTFTELKKAVELGYTIDSCNWCVRWKKTKINPLSEFIQHLHDLERNCETKEEKSPIKLIRNNLWAKFAQNRNSKEIKVAYRDEVQSFIEQGYHVTASIDDKYIIVKEGEKYIPTYVNPIISILISAEAKKYLYEFITKVPKEDMLYCDTDSIMFKGNHIDKFPIGEEMGMFKLESKGDAKILGEKRYYINDVVKISGLPKRNCHKSYIEEECDAIIQRINGLQQGIFSGRLELVGSFNKFTMEMKPHAKIEIPMPLIIDERGIATEANR